MTAAAITTRTEVAAAARPRAKAARREVLIQCDRCAVMGDGMHNGRRLASVTLAATNTGPGHWHHRDCGGRLVAFDNASKG